MKMSKETFYLGLSHFFIKVYKILRLARKISPRHLKCCTCRMGSACPKIKNDDGFTNLWTLSKRHPNSPNTVPATKNDLQKPLSFWPRPANVLDVLATSRSATPATWMKKCPMSCACHAKRRSRPQTPATQNGHSSKNEHGDLRKRQNRTAHLVRAGAVEMHMDISQGNFCARIYGEIAKDLMMMKHPDLTPALYLYP